MGPVIDGAAQSRITKTISTATATGAEVAYSGAACVPSRGFFVGPTLLDRVAPTMNLFQDEIFGPVLSMVRPKTLDEAIATMNTLGYGNGATLFSASGAAARQFTREIQCGMLGINGWTSVPVSMSLS